MAKKQKLKLNFGDDGSLLVTENQYQENVMREMEEETKRKSRLGGTVVSDENKLKFIPENDLFNDLDVFFANFFEKIARLGLTDSNTNQIIALSSELIQSYTTATILSLGRVNQNMNDDIVKLRVIILLSN